MVAAHPSRISPVSDYDEQPFNASEHVQEYAVFLNINVPSVSQEVC